MSVSLLQLHSMRSGSPESGHPSQAYGDRTVSPDGKATILFVSAGQAEQGAPHQLMPAIWLAHRGYDVLCICHGTEGARILDTPISALRTDQVAPRSGVAGKLKWHLALLRRLIRMRLHSPSKSIFYIHGSVVAPAAWLALAFVPRRRVLYHTQDYLEPGRHRLWAFFERRMARRAGYVLCNEPNRARFMASNYRLGEVPMTVRTALPRDWPRPRFDREVRHELLRHVGREKEDNACLIIHQGSFSSARCTSELIEALSLLPANYCLVMTGIDPGSGGNKAGHANVERLGLANRVVYLGYLPYGMLLRYTAACDIGVLLYPDDGIGNFYQAPGRLTEYLGAGLPVITSDFPGLELLVIKHGLGAVANPASPHDIARAIAEIGDTWAPRFWQRRDRLRTTAQTELAFESHGWKLEQIMEELGAAKLERTGALARGEHPNA